MNVSLNLSNLIIFLILYITTMTFLWIYYSDEENYKKK